MTRHSGKDSQTRAHTAPPERQDRESRHASSSPGVGSVSQTRQDDVANRLGSSGHDKENQFIAFAVQKAVEEALARERRRHQSAETARHSVRTPGQRCSGDG